ncbi:MAG: hypothetical protein ACLPVF_17015 [Acidimicrobiales bacterium]
MQGHLPTPPQPQWPIGLAPVIGYVATREPQPLEERDPVQPEWWEIDEVEEEWGPRHSRVVRVTAVLLSFALAVAGVGTVLELVLSAH